MIQRDELSMNEFNIVHEYGSINPHPYFHTIKFYPNNNIYPLNVHFKFDHQELSKNAGLFKFNDSDSLFLAVLWLQEKRVEYVLRDKLDYKTESNFLNPLEMLCRNLCGHFYTYKCNEVKFHRIAMMLITFNPSWITEKCFSMLYHDSFQALIDILSKF